MARYPLNLPPSLKKEVEEWAAKQKISLNKFIMWAVAEKVGELRQGLDDPEFPHITYRRGAAGVPTPLIRGTGVRVQTIIIANRTWSQSLEQLADEYGLTQDQVKEALSFYKIHSAEIDVAIEREQKLEIENA